MTTSVEETKVSKVPSEFTNSTACNGRTMIMTHNNPQVNHVEFLTRMYEENQSKVKYIIG